MDNMSDDTKLGKEDRLFKSWPLQVNIPKMIATRVA